MKNLSHRMMHCFESFSLLSFSFRLPAEDSLITLLYRVTQDYLPVHRSQFSVSESSGGKKKVYHTKTDSVFVVKQHHNH
jgi:hypothetical protein